MKDPKKALLAAVCALGAVAVLALPASASAAVWKHEGKNLEKKVELAMTGGEFLEVSGAAMVCNSTATMTTEGGSTASMSAYNIDKASCFGLAGKLEGCEATATTPTGVPWSVAVNATDLTVKNVKVDYSFNKTCGIQKIEMSISSLTVTPESASAIRLFHWNQETKAQVDGKETALTYSGSLNLAEKDLETYGIG